MFYNFKANKLNEENLIDDSAYTKEIDNEKLISIYNSNGKKSSNSNCSSVLIANNNSASNTNILNISKENLNKITNSATLNSLNKSSISSSGLVSSVSASAAVHVTQSTPLSKLQNNESYNTNLINYVNTINSSESTLVSISHNYRVTTTEKQNENLDNQSLNSISISPNSNLNFSKTQSQNDLFHNQKHLKHDQLCLVADKNKNKISDSNPSLSKANYNKNDNQSSNNNSKTNSSTSISSQKINKTDQDLNATNSTLKDTPSPSESLCGKGKCKTQANIFNKNEINLNCNFNLNNTINNRYQHFEKRRNSISSSEKHTQPNIQIISSKNNLMNKEDESAINEFNLRVNKLRFIDDSASSTALTSPAESMTHLYFNCSNNSSFIKKQQQQQHRLLGSSTSSSTSSSRTVSLPASSCCSQSGSAQSTPVTNRAIRANRVQSIQRQANVKSSTDTLCSEEHHYIPFPKQYQHENLPSKYSSIHSIQSNNQDIEDDEEIKNIIQQNKCNNNSINSYLVQKASSKMSQSQSQSSFVSDLDSSEAENKNNKTQFNYKQQSPKSNQTRTDSSEDDSYYSHLYAENKKLLEKSKYEKNCKFCKSIENQGGNDSDSSSACSASLNYFKGAKNSNRTNQQHYKQAKTSNNHYYHHKVQFYGYSPVNRGFKNSGDDRVYAYDNFDCINECLEENESHLLSNNQINQNSHLINDKKTNVEEDADEDDNETSNLVEDGFIRMSSPVDENDYSNKKSAFKISKSKNSIEKNSNLDLNALDTGSELNEMEFNNIDVCLCTNKINYNQTILTNFPNVGSSPLSEEFINTSVSEQEDYNEEQEQDSKRETQLINLDSKVNENGPQKDGLSNDYDGIIVHSCSDSTNTNEVISLSDEEDLIVEAEDNEFEYEQLIENLEPKQESRAEANDLDSEYTSQFERNEILNSNKMQTSSPIQHEFSKLVRQTSLQSNSTTNTNTTISSEPRQPHSIMKAKSSCLKAQHSFNLNDHQSSISNIAASSTNFNYLPCQTSSPIPNDFVQLSNSSPIGAQHQSKPKVRFNLDINYEKEREWNRVNKIIGDASKTQIEWTQEVEV